MGNANPYISGAAAAELLSLHSAGTELSAETMERMGQKASGIAGASWLDDALDATDNAKNAVINGQAAASRSRYGEALLFFRIALNESPELFFSYPDLLNDLGRCFQYTATGNEGIDLFLDWEKNLAEEENIVRFRLLFFAGRIARQRGNNGIEYFERALPCIVQEAGQGEQSDACIWYILDASLSLGCEATIQYLEKYISQWHDAAYFDDIMDKLARELVLNRQWETVLKVFAITRNRSGASAAQYAWITGRAIEEGLFSLTEIDLAGDMLPDAVGGQNEIAKAYKHIAYDEADSPAALPDDKALYYRYLSSEAIGKQFLVLPTAPSETPLETPQAKSSPAKATSAKTGESEAMQFLLGFFRHNAAQFAPRHIRALENDLSPAELRSVAAALAAAGQYRESMRLVSHYIRREGYQPEREDMELRYPRPYRELVEQYAEDTGVDPAVLFALMRTESAFDPNAVSRAGAIGLAQLMPATAEETAARILRRGGPDYAISNSEEAEAGEGGDSSVDLRDPAANIHIGASYLAYLNDRMDDPLLALLAYNGGMNRIRRWRNSAQGNLPPDLFLETVEFAETREYGRKVMAATAMYGELY